MSPFIRKFFCLDRQAHIGRGSQICAVFTIITLLQDIAGPLTWWHIMFCAIGTVAALIFALAKELVIDAKADWIDIAATMWGCVYIWVATTIGVALNILMHTYGHLLTA